MHVASGGDAIIAATWRVRRPPKISFSGCASELRAIFNRGPAHPFAQEPAVFSRFFRPGVALMLISILCAYLAGTWLEAHDGDLGMLNDLQAPYSGPGWSGSDGGAPEIDFPSDNVELLSWIPGIDFAGASTSGNTCEGYVSPGGREYAIIGLGLGTGFADITDPGDPQIVGFIPSIESLWRDVWTYQTYCYTVSEGGGGIQIINLNQIDLGVVSLVGSVNTPGSSSTHTAFVNKDTGYLYRCGGGSTLGVRIYSLANPANPTYVATALSSRYVHECQTVLYTSGPYAGKEILFCYSNTNSGGGSPGVDILDITNKANIIWLSQATYPNPRFSHQGWLSPDYHYIYLNDELDHQNVGGNPTLTRIIDVSNLSAPVYVGSFDNGAGSIDHNLYTKDNLIFESNYRSGLRVFDATNPLAPTEVAFFDTYPPDNNKNFNGLWDNYPYLPSGTVIGSDIEKGLFVWHIGPSMLVFDFPNGQPDLINPNGANVAVTISNQSGTLAPATAKLWLDTGGGFVATNLVPVNGNLFNAAFPAVACGTPIKYYISAQTTSGTTVRFPAGAPTSYFTVTAATDAFVGITDTLETNTGWVVGAPGDNAATGVWTRVDPIGTAAQPEDDHTPVPGVMCWVTGQGSVGGGVGENDIDGGTTTLTSPTMDATQGDLAFIEYYRWYSNNQGASPDEDTMPVQISNNNGASWVQLELVSENAGDWVSRSFRVDDFVTPSNQMKLRFIARDLGNGSVVEAGVDDVRIVYYNCGTTVPGDINGDGFVNVIDLLAVINAWGPCPAPPAACPADVTNDGFVNVSDLLFVISNWG
jgi:choice-of-anchor B domain-containing protein